MSEGSPPNRRDGLRRRNARAGEFMNPFSAPVDCGEIEFQIEPTS